MKAIFTKLFCSTFFWRPDGRYLGKHRKLKPAEPERLVWSQGDGSELTAFERRTAKWAFRAYCR